jgi:hypothetical protein
MLTMRNLLIAGALFLASLVLFAIFVGLHSSFHTCVDNAAETYRTEHYVNSDQPVPSVPIFHGYAACASFIAKRDAEAITGVFTALLTLVTLLLVFLGREQSQTTRAQLRAYVYGKGVKCRQETATNNIGNVYVVGYSFWVPYENFGATPAHKLRCNAAILHFPMNTEDDFPPVRWGYGNSIMAGPGEKLATQKVNITATEALGCWHRQLEICLQFHFEYTDVIETRKTRITNYEVRLEPAIDPRTVVADGDTVFLILPYGPNNRAT